jgi:hypothetical protein
MYQVRAACSDGGLPDAFSVNGCGARHITRSCCSYAPALVSSTKWLTTAGVWA